MRVIELLVFISLQPCIFASPVPTALQDQHTPLPQHENIKSISKLQATLVGHIDTNSHVIETRPSIKKLQIANNNNTTSSHLDAENRERSEDDKPLQINVPPTAFVGPRKKRSVIGDGPLSKNEDGVSSDDEKPVLRCGNDRHGINPHLVNGTHIRETIVKVQLPEGRIPISDTPVEGAEVESEARDKEVEKKKRFDNFLKWFL